MGSQDNFIMSRDEAKRILRRLELEAYSAIVSAFRAQGELHREKRKLLHDLGIQLSISTERHRAEVRRALSDDRLGLLAERIFGPNTSGEWASEGRRTVPLMPRLVPQTIFTATATAAANGAALTNSKLQTPTKPVVEKVEKTSHDTEDEDTEADEDGKAKAKKRLKTTSPVKQIQKIVSSTFAKTVTKSVAPLSSVTKQIKPVTTVMTTRVVPKTSMSASQVKLLTKTVSITQTGCQGKTILSYTPTSSMASSLPQVKQQSTSVTVPTSPRVLVSPVTTQIPTTTTAAASTTTSTSPVSKASVSTQLHMVDPGKPKVRPLAPRQRGKPPRFKPLPGTVKFKSVTPGVSSTSVVMVTPSTVCQAASSAGSLVGKTTTLTPMVKVLQVSQPMAGSVAPKSLVVMSSAGLSNKTVTPQAIMLTAGGMTSKLPASSGSAVTGSKAPQVSGQSAKTLFTASTKTTALTTSQMVTAALPKTVIMTTSLSGGKSLIITPSANVLIQAQSQNLTPASVKPDPSISAGITLEKGSLKTAPLTTTASPVSLGLASGLPSPNVPSAAEIQQTVSQLAAITDAQLIAPSSAKLTTVSSALRAPRSLQPILPKSTTTATTAATSTNTSSPSNGRKLPVILPAPAKTLSVVPAVVLPVMSITSTTPDIPTEPQVSRPVEKPGPVLAQITSTQEDKPSTAEEALTREDVSASLMNNEGELEGNVTDTDTESTVSARSSPDVTVERSAARKVEDAHVDTQELTCHEKLTVEDIEPVRVEPRSATVIMSNVQSSPQSVSQVSSTTTPSQPKEITPIPTVVETPVIVRDPKYSEATTKASTVSPERPVHAVVSIPDTVPIWNIKPELLSVSTSIVENTQMKRVSTPVSSVISVPVDSSTKDIDTTVKDTPALFKDTGAVKDSQSTPVRETGNAVITRGPAVLVERLDVATPCLSSVITDSSFQSMSDSSYVQDYAQSNIVEGMNSSKGPLYGSGIYYEGSFDGGHHSASHKVDQSSIDPQNAKFTGRKRKISAPTPPDASPPRQMLGWVRSALGLLQKVSKFKGNRQRSSGHFAASWFLKPVDAEDAPGYHKIIKHPMDFGTIKEKLENGTYTDLYQFHSDMMLVKANCVKYNPPGHMIRQDCDEVFLFYETEYAKVMERWEKCHVSPAKKPKVITVKQEKE